MKSLLWIGALALSSAGAYGQLVSVGVKGGYVSSELQQLGRGASDESRQYTVGPTIEVKLPFGLAAETGFLYKRQGYSSTFTGTFNGVTGTVNQRVRRDMFEVPVLGKYYFRGLGAFGRPFVAGGATFRRGMLEANGTNFGTGQGIVPFQVSGLPIGWHYGGTAAAGVQFGAGRLKIAPEFRYTRWEREVSFPQGRNQYEVLLGLRF